MSWQEIFDQIFFPYLMNSALIKDNKVNKEDLNIFLKKILKDEYNLNIILTIYFLIDERIQFFINKHLIVLINSLTIRSISEHKTSKGYVKGKLMINSTMKEFRLKQYQPTFYKCKEINRNYNIPENQLLKYLLEKIRDLIFNLPKDLIIKAEDESQEISKDNSIELENLMQTISNLKRLLMKLIKNVKIKAIELPKVITVDMLNRVLKSRNPLYKKVYEIYDIYQKIFDSETLEIDQIHRILNFNKIIPTSPDKQFEILILILIIKSLDSSAQFKLDEFSLILPKREYIANYIYNSNFNLKIYYNQIPKSILGPYHSEYFRTIRLYNLGPSLRRPDIIFEISELTEEKINYFFIEVKNSMDKTYILNSVYKCFAYLYDFKKLFLENSKPKIALFIDHSNEIFRNFNTNDRIKRRNNLKVFSWKHLLETNEIIPLILKNLIENIYKKDEIHGSIIK